MTADLILMKRKVSMPTMRILSTKKHTHTQSITTQVIRGHVFPPPHHASDSKLMSLKGQKNKIKLKGKSQAAKKVVLGAIVRDFSIFCET